MRVARQHTTTLNDVDAESDETRLEVALDAVGEVLGVIGDTLTVIADIVDSNSEGFQVLRILHFANASTGGQEGLAGDTTAVDAGTTDVVAGKDGGFEVLGTTVKGSSVTADTASNDGDIKVVRPIGHFQLRGATHRGRDHSGEGSRASNKDGKAMDDKLHFPDYSGEQYILWKSTVSAVFEAHK